MISMVFNWKSRCARVLYIYPDFLFFMHQVYLMNFSSIINILVLLYLLPGQVLKVKNRYPISTLPEHIHSTILSYRQNYLKTYTQTMETSFHPPLTLVSLLANYPHSHYLPPHWGSHLHTPLYSHSIFWRHESNVSCAASCTFVLFAFCFGSKVTGVYHASFLETFRD